MFFLFICLFPSVYAGFRCLLLFICVYFVYSVVSGVFLVRRVACSSEVVWRVDRFAYICVWTLKSYSMPWQRRFENAQEIYDAAMAYMDKLKAEPLHEEVFVGKEGRRENKTLKRIPTWEGFAVFCGTTSSYFRELKRSRGARTEEEHEEILTVLTYIKDMFYSDKAEAASAGLAHPSFIIHELGMNRQAEQLEANIASGQLVIQVIPPKADDED